MNLQPFKSVVVTSLLLVASAIASRPVFSQPTGFFCGTAGGNPATMATQQGKNIPVIVWLAKNYFNESGEDAITRCTRVSGILNSYHQQGNWGNLISTGVSRAGQPMICVANAQDGSCRLLYQVPRGQNPEQARQELLRRVSNPAVSSSPIAID